MKTLNVENSVQKALFEMELKGQLSDGHWENTKPSNHWECWCDAEVVVDPENVGRNFWAKRDNYNFTSKAFLDAVLPRMLAYARITLAYGQMMAERVKALIDDETGRIELPKYEGEYWAEQRAIYHSIQGIGVIATAECATVYTKHHLLADLRALKHIVRVRCKAPMLVPNRADNCTPELGATTYVVRIEDLRTHLKTRGWTMCGDFQLHDKNESSPVGSVVFDNGLAYLLINHAL